MMRTPSPSEQQDGVAEWQKRPRAHAKVEKRRANIDLPILVHTTPARRTARRMS
jgi:hypothetical protein